MTYRGRFAPSPTGPLHFGSLVAALASWLDARAAGGEWLVRIEDVDETRTVAGSADDILRTLASLGLAWDGDVAWQSRRKDRYEQALARLRAQGRLYRCKCSRKEVADSGLHGIEGAIYPGTCRGLAIAADVPAALRVIAGDERIGFEDRVQGFVSQNVARDIGDFVLKRRDGLHAYQLAVVVDDADQAITDVVRGADLLWSTPRQIALQRLLGLPTPRYLHVPVATHGSGEKLSKQTLAAAIATADPAALLGALEFLGQPAPDSRSIAAILEHAVRQWDPARIPRAASLAVPSAPR